MKITKTKYNPRHKFFPAPMLDKAIGPQTTTLRGEGERKVRTDEMS